MARLGHWKGHRRGSPALPAFRRTAAVIELLALRVMGYSSPSPSSGDRGMAEPLHAFPVFGGASAVVAVAGLRIEHRWMRLPHRR